VSRQDSRFPGALTLAQFNQNPRQTNTPNDYASIDTNRFTAFVERKLGDWEAAAELSHRERKADAFYLGSWGASSVKYDTHQTQFSPRLRKVSASGGVTNELVAGLDFTHWNRTDNSTYSQADATQNSRAIYLRDEVKLGKARVAAGFRHENFDKDSSGSAVYSTKQSLNAWELQGSYAVAPVATVFAKAGRSYRVGNADENAQTALANDPLKPQTSNDLEFGATLGNQAKKVTVRLFQHKLHDEIFFDPTAGYYGANVNLDPTRRRGIEIEASLRLAPALMLNANAQHVQASFTDGSYAGREMVMVPKNTATARLSWLPGSGQTASVGMQWADEQRYGGDFDNTCSAKIPSHLTFDARYAKKIGQWEFAVSGANLTNKHYFSNAYGCRYGIYPDAGRQLKVSARYDF
ncbi:MAG: TonB-dependent receptor, partial [Burkholderiaceae bacterium]|nr:TonB-dependent receptor [Burkholderiaceae bacterium]